MSDFFYFLFFEAERISAYVKTKDRHKLGSGSFIHSYFM